MRVLAIGAHPDDIEIFMYGLIARFKEEGHEILMFVATDGSLGGKEKDQNLIETRKKESINALKDIGKLHFLGLPDGDLGDHLNHKIIIKEKIKVTKPDVVITHYKEDYHSDHRILSDYVTNITGHDVPVIFCDTMMGLKFIPNYYVDITKYFKAKQNAIMKHESQNPKRFVDLAKLMNSYRAAQCNAPIGIYAEAYYFNRSFPFTDITNILPDSLGFKPFHISKVHGFL